MSDKINYITQELIQTYAPQLPQSGYHKFYAKYNGTTLELWVSDPINGDQLVWPQAASVACPAPMTRAALINLRNTSALLPNCDYVITDFASGRLVAGTLIHLHAINSSTLSLEARIKTTYDNVAWQGVYDIDTNIVYELQDNRNNTVRDNNGTAVYNFDWGNSAYTNCLVDASTLTVTYGAVNPVNRLVLRGASTLVLTGRVGGSLNDVVIDDQSTVNLTNSRFTMIRSSIKGSTNFNASGHTGNGTIDRLITNSANINLSASTTAVNMTAVRIDSAAILNHSNNTTGSLLINYTDIIDNAQVNTTGISGYTPGAVSITACNIRGTNTDVNVRYGPLTMLASDIIASGKVYKLDATATGALSVSYCVVSAATVRNYGAASMNIISTTADSGSGIYAQNGAGGTMSVSNCAVSTGSTIYKMASATTNPLNVSSCSLDTGGYIYHRGTGTLTVQLSAFSGNGRIDGSDTNARSTNVYACSFTNVGRLNRASTGTVGVTDFLHYVTVSDYAIVNYNATGAAANNLYYSSIRGNGGTFTFGGTNTGSTVSRVDIANGVILFSGNTVAIPTAFNMACYNGSSINVSSCTAAPDIRGISATNTASFNISSKTVASQVWDCEVSNRARITSSNTSTVTYQVRADLGGAINQTAGSLTQVVKTMSGTLTTGNFTHANIQHHVSASKTLTTANTNRADYQGLAAQLV